MGAYFTREVIILYLLFSHNLLKKHITKDLKKIYRIVDEEIFRFAADKRMPQSISVIMLAKGGQT
jgi:hypothetical protein